MAKSEGPPRKTETYNTFEGMNTQSERYGIEKTEFAWLENIMWVGPHKLHSVPGPRAIAIMPVPPPSPHPCPPVTTVNHIDTGFTLSMVVGSGVLDQVTDPDHPVVYTQTGHNDDWYVQKFDMAAIGVAWEVKTASAGQKWLCPGVDFSNGNLYVEESFGANHAIVQLNTSNGSEVRRSPNFTASQVREASNALRITSNSIFGAFSSPGINLVYAINKSDLALRWTTSTLGSGLGTANRIGGFCTDGAGNLWVTVGDSTRVGLIKVDPTTGAGTLFDITSSFSTPSSGNIITYDPTNDTIIIFGDENVMRWDLSDNSIHDLGFSSQGLTLANGNQNVVNGTMWVNQSNRIQERNSFTGALIQEILKTSMSGITVPSWFGMTMMTNLNCLFASHQAIGTGTLGGVDSICLPC